MISADFLVICERSSTDRKRLDLFGVGLCVFAFSPTPITFAVGYQLRYTQNDVGKITALRIDVLDADDQSVSRTVEPLEVPPVTAAPNLDGIMQSGETVQALFPRPGQYTLRLSEGGMRLADTRIDIIP